MARMPDLPRIVTELDQLRDRAGVTVYAVAKDAGVSAQTAANLLTGSGGKTVAHLAAMGEALGYRLAWVEIAKTPGSRRGKRGIS